MDIQTRPYPVYVKGVNGKALPIQEEVDLTVDFSASINLGVHALVLPILKHDLILGVDSLAKGKVVIDYNKEELEIKGRRIPFFRNTTSSELKEEVPEVTEPKECYVVVNQPTVIPGGSLGWVSVSFQGINPPLISIEKSIYQRGNKTFFMPDMTLVPECQEKIPIVNPSSDELILPERMKLTQYSSSKEEICMFVEKEPISRERFLEAVSKDLTEQERETMVELLWEYRDVFAKDGEIGEVHITPVKIDLLPGIKPIKQAPYRTSEYEQECIREQLQEMLDLDCPITTDDFSGCSVPAGSMATNIRQLQGRAFGTLVRRAKALSGMLTADLNYLNLTTDISDGTEDVELNMGRRRRSTLGLDFISKFYRYCCGFATSQETLILSSRQKQVGQYIKKLREGISINHRDVIRMGEKMSEFAKNAVYEVKLIQDYLRWMNGTYQRFSPRLDEVGSTLLNLKFLVGEQVSLAHQSQIVGAYEQLQDICHQKRLPKLFIPPSVLEPALIKLKGALLRKYRDFAIPMNATDLYYRYPLAECLEDKNTYVIKLQIPFVSLGKK
ncbi:unnamed protein product [Allacma fusca]|uniref:Uncharacterized protein n=1 Tax=Allacma fusca TaxID=39272 RepID=A0A8J2PM55_9HEXA|nr:unnamed protein product [Allacma fusca]